MLILRKMIGVKVIIMIIMNFIMYIDIPINNGRNYEYGTCSTHSGSYSWCRILGFNCKRKR